MAETITNKGPGAASPTMATSSGVATAPMGIPSSGVHAGNAPSYVTALDGSYANVGSGTPGMPPHTGMLASPAGVSQSERQPTIHMGQVGIQSGPAHSESSSAAGRAVMDAGSPAVAAATAVAAGATAGSVGANGEGHTIATVASVTKGETVGGGSGGTAGATTSGSPNGVVPGSGGSKGTLGKRSGSQSQSKPQSAWMLFIQDRREQVKLDNPDIAVTQQQKIMSEIWKTMSGDEREAYRSRARDDQKRYKAEQADKPAVKKEDLYGSTEGGTSTELVCPLGRIGRIIKLDQDVQSVTKEATALIGKAMELFTALVAKEAFAVSQSQNRRLLKLQDITDIMHNQDQFYWIKDDFPLPPR